MSGAAHGSVTVWDGESHKKVTNTKKGQELPSTTVH